MNAMNTSKTANQPKLEPGEHHLAPASTFMYGLTRILVRPIIFLPRKLADRRIGERSGRRPRHTGNEPHPLDGYSAGLVERAESHALHGKDRAFQRTAAWRLPADAGSVPGAPGRRRSRLHPYLGANTGRGRDTGDLPRRTPQRQWSAAGGSSRHRLHCHANRSTSDCGGYFRHPESIQAISPER